MAQAARGFEVQVMAVERVERLLRRVCEALDGAGIAHAVVGGNAVALWVATVDEDAVRATKDVDMVVRREDLWAITDAFRPMNLTPAEVLGVHIFVDRSHPSPRSGLHLVMANELVRPHYQYPAPDPSRSKRLAGLQVIDLPELLEMKLQADRNIDRAHIQDLLSVGLLDQTWADRLPPDLRVRYEEILLELRE